MQSQLAINASASQVSWRHIEEPICIVPISGSEPEPGKVHELVNQAVNLQPRMRHIADLDLQLFENFEMDITPLK